MRLAVACLALNLGCTARATPVPAQATPSASSSSRSSTNEAMLAGAADAPSEPPPTPEREPDAPRLRSLDVPGFRAPLLYSPAGSERRPLLIATHGAGGSADWECAYWTRLTAGQVFVLCLAGTPLGHYQGFYYRDHLALERELNAAEAVARAAEPRILAESGLYAGFSQGSTMGTSMIGKHGQSFPYLVLIEGFQLWNIPAARAFARAGGKRVLIACGSKECAKVGRDSVRYLGAGGIDARLEFAPGAGHTPTGAVQARVEAALPWLLEGDPRWP